MECIPTKEVDAAKWESFVQETGHINKETMKENGYVVLVGDHIIGCFQLEQIDNGTCWLKQLYINRSEAGKLPVLLEYILLLARKTNVTTVYAHSEQPVTDLLLESMCFTLQNRTAYLPKNNKNGNWWAYQVS